LGKIIKKRKRSRINKERKTISSDREKLMKRVGIMAIMGISNAAMYMLFKQNRPSAR
jgi:hypothetical protein